jgi:hypothetical protein
MHFDERKIGDYRVFAGALEGPQGDGYIAALVVQRKEGRVVHEVLRDEGLACNHRWRSAAEALAYAMSKGFEVVRKQTQPQPEPQALTC